MVNLKDYKVAILVTDGFEQSELLEPKKALEKAGAKALIISPTKGKVKSWTNKNWGEEIPVDLELERVNPEEFDALVLPGGVINPDKLRITPAAIQLIKHFVKEGKPIAAICHGPWTLIDAEGVRGKTMTSWPSLKMDLINAGAKWVDQQVVKDGNLVTSRKPDDLPAFCETMIEVFSKTQPAKSR